MKATELLDEKCKAYTVSNHVLLELGLKAKRSHSQYQDDMSFKPCFARIRFERARQACLAYKDLS